MKELNGFKNSVIYTTMVTNDISYTIDKNVRFVQCDVYHKNNRLK